MDANNQSMMVEGANPDMLWIQHIDYLATQSKIMKKEYIRRKRANKPFTWNDLDVMNKKIHHDLDVVMSGVENVQENKQNTNMNKKLIRLTESDLHKIVKESVKRVLKEGTKETILVNSSSDGSRLFYIELADNLYVRSFKAFGYDESEALEYVCKYLDKKGIEVFYADPELVEEYPDDYIEIGGHYLQADMVLVRQIR